MIKNFNLFIFLLQSLMHRTQGLLRQKGRHGYQQNYCARLVKLRRSVPPSHLSISPPAWRDTRAPFRSGPPPGEGQPSSSDISASLHTLGGAARAIEPAPPCKKWLGHSRVQQKCTHLPQRTPPFVNSSHVAAERRASWSSSPASAPAGNSVSEASTSRPKEN